MYRALFVLGGFTVVSPTVRNYLFDGFQFFSKLVVKHTTIAFVATGVLCFASFLWIQLSSERR